MRLYSKTGATRIDSAHGSFTPDPSSGAFDGLPNAVYEDLHGRPDWESEDERAHRLASEELDRFRDPAELLKAVKELGANQGLLTQALATALGLGASQPAATPADSADNAGAPDSSTPPDAPAAEAADTPPAELPTAKPRSRKSATSTPPAQ